MSAAGHGRRRRRHEDHEEHASEAWLIAFADMMTLLMVTFLMMFAISSLDLEKLRAFQEALQEGLGKSLPKLSSQSAPPEVPLGPPVGEPTPAATPVPVETGKPLQREDLAQLKAQLDAAVAAAGLAGEVNTGMDPRGLVIYVTNGALFDAGRAALTPAGRQLLTRLGPVLAPIDNDIVVEGHTDSRPISTREFPSNWELSTARATAVLRHLLDAVKVPSERLSAAGYADTRPRDPGTSPAALARNRRVDIVVLAPVPPNAPAPPVTAAPAAASGQPVPTPVAAPEPGVPAQQGGD